MKAEPDWIVIMLYCNIPNCLQDVDKEADAVADEEDQAEDAGDADDEGEAEHVEIPEVEEQSPEEFDARGFLGNLDELAQTLKAEQFQNLDEEFPLSELKVNYN